VIAEIDLALIMSVNPGFGGQQFIPNAITKTKEVAKMASEAGTHQLSIEIDGGVSLANAPALIEAGANALVAGSFVFNSKDPKETISQLVGLVK
jgi:ribulose-phosphate 3-epimerase